MSTISEVRSEERSDVIVAGGGIAGLALTTALADAGMRVALLEANPRPDAAVGTASESDLSDWDRRVSALTLGSQRFLDTLDAWSGMAARRVGPYTVMDVWDAEGTGQISFNAAEGGVPCLGHIVENGVTVAALVEAAESRRGAYLHWETAVQDVDATQPDAVAVRTSDGQVLQAPLLVAADGARSPIREQLGFATRAWSYEQRAIVATVRLGVAHNDTCYQAFLATGPVALLPLADPQLCSLVWSVDDAAADTLTGLTPQDFTRALERAMAGSGLDISEVGEYAVFPLRQCHAVDYFQGRVVLVADAAHSIHPLAGQGINLGLSDVRVLAAEITAAFHDDLDWGAPRVLARYQRQRKTENLAMMTAMEAFKRGFGADNSLVRVLRNAGLGWVDASNSIKRWLISQAIA